MSDVVNEIVEHFSGCRTRADVCRRSVETDFCLIRKWLLATVSGGHPEFESFVCGKLGI